MSLIVFSQDPARHDVLFLGQMILCPEVSGCNWCICQEVSELESENPVHLCAELLDYGATCSELKTLVLVLLCFFGRLGGSFLGEVFS